MPNSGLGLYSVAVQMGSIGGEYDFRPRGGENKTIPDGKPVTGCIFWFQIPLIRPDNNAVNDDSIKNNSIHNNFTNLNAIPERAKRNPCKCYLGAERFAGLALSALAKLVRRRKISNLEYYSEPEL
jgi:hypothetical protein